MRRYGTGMLAAGLLAASAAWAQSSAVTLGDGRTLTAGGATAQCRAPSRSQDAEGAIALDYNCTVPGFDGAGRVEGIGALVMLPRAGQASAEGFLRRTQQQWWPGMAIADLAAPTREMKATANGRLAVICVYRDNVEALNGDALCVVDQPGLQVVISGQSTMAATADNVIDAILAGSTVR